MKIEKDRLTLKKPFDAHLHLRDGAMLRLAATFAARSCSRAVVMPNLDPPVRTVDEALAYKKRIQEAAAPVFGGGSRVGGGEESRPSFEPLMTLYLTDATDPKTVDAAKAAGLVGFKFYPKGATTNSDMGVSDILGPAVAPALERMARIGMPLLCHGEAPDPGVDIFDRERVFVETKLIPLKRRYPELKATLEHVTTIEGAQYVADGDGSVCASVTPQHVLFNRNDLLSGGLKPHLYCMPILKSEAHRAALVKAVTGPMASRFFLGTDSAPHERGKKECAQGCAGVFSGDCFLELYAELFEREGALGALEGFSSTNAERFYGLKPSSQTVELVRREWSAPDSYRYGEGALRSVGAGRVMRWQMADRGSKTQPAPNV